MKFIPMLLMLLCFTSITCLAQKALYANFPENFESPDTAAKAHYKAETIKLKTGEWVLDYALLGALAGHDHFNPTGKQSIRMQQNRSKPAYVEMNFDLSEGASKVTVAYAAYYKDVASVWCLEYSTDGGPSIKNGRLSIDDITIYKN